MFRNYQRLVIDGKIYLTKEFLGKTLYYKCGGGRNVVQLVSTVEEAHAFSSETEIHDCAEQMIERDQDGNVLY